MSLRNSDLYIRTFFILLFVAILHVTFDQRVATAEAGCNPCICGMGGGIPPPPECFERNMGAEEDFASWVEHEKPKSPCKAPEG